MTATTIRRPSRRLDTAPQRILSLGLATATAVGLVGVIGVRTAQDSAAAENTDTTASATTEPTTSTGLTQADLDAYAAQLEAERQNLATYRAQLVDVAGQLQARANGTVNVGAPAKVPSVSTVKKAKPTAKPKAQPKAQVQQAPAPKPQAQSKSS